MGAFLQRVFNVRREEWLPVLLAALFFFCVLTALMMIRPARDALGMQRGIEEVRWLFIGTAVVTLLVNPVFGWLVARLPRLRFVAATYGFFALGLIGFHGLLTAAPQSVGVVSGQVFYVWFSVFNLFATMLFWALVADRFSLAQGKRFFPLIAAGGTLGAICGPWLAGLLAQPLGTATLLPLSAGFLLAAVATACALVRVQPERAWGDDAEAPAFVDESARIGGKAWEGLRATLHSPYLLGIAAYVLILAVMVTFLYFTRLQMVAGLAENLDQRTTWFAHIDLATQLATLALQAVLAGHLMRRLGVPVTLALLPLTVALGFVGLAMVASIAVLVVFEAVFRAVQRAVMRPARETLYTVVGREEKYKAKAFIDTFGYRIGDVAGAQTEGLLGRLGMGLAALASVAIPLALAWAALGIWLGRAQQRLADERAGNPDTGRAADAASTSP
jgi:AAA family ATP:ADP antiporter